MKLESLSVVALHGNISHKLDFREDLNLLVGINGSGKTSVLNAIDWVLRFDIKRLCIVPFSSITVAYRQGGRRHVLEVTQDTKSLKIRLLRSKWKPIVVDFLIHPSKLRPEQTQQVFVHYDSLGPERHERSLWQYMLQLEKPVVITLDRALSAELDGDSVFLEEASIRVRQRRPPTVSPIAKVRQVAAERFAKYMSRTAELNEQLKANIIMSAFQSPIARMPGEIRRNKFAVNKFTVADVNRLQKKVTDLALLRQSPEQACSA